MLQSLPYLPSLSFSLCTLTNASISSLSSFSVFFASVPLLILQSLPYLLSLSFCLSTLTTALIAYLPSLCYSISIPLPFYGHLFPVFYSLFLYSLPSLTSSPLCISPPSSPHFQPLSTCLSIYQTILLISWNLLRHAC